MRWPFVTRSRYELEIAEKERQARHSERDRKDARQQIDEYKAFIAQRLPQFQVVADRADGIAGSCRIIIQFDCRHVHNVFEWAGDEGALAILSEVIARRCREELHRLNQYRTPDWKRIR